MQVCALRQFLAAGCAAERKAAGLVGQPARGRLLELGPSTVGLCVRSSCHSVAETATSAWENSGRVTTEMQAALIEALQAERDYPPHRLVIDHGCAFEPALLPSDLAAGEPRCCFFNAFTLANDDPVQYTYFEGSPRTGLRGREGPFTTLRVSPLRRESSTRLGRAGPSIRSRTGVSPFLSRSSSRTSATTRAGTLHAVAHQLEIVDATLGLPRPAMSCTDIA
jgi:hypothetical protein